MRQYISGGLALGLFTLLPLSKAAADDLPVRKAGLWEMKMMRTGSPMPEMTMQHCTDETTDKEMSTAFSPMAKRSARRRISRKPRLALSAIPCVALLACRSRLIPKSSATSIPPIPSRPRPAAKAVRWPEGRSRHDDRGEMAWRLQARSKARRHHDAQRTEDEHPRHGQAEGVPARSSAPK